MPRCVSFFAFCCLVLAATLAQAAPRAVATITTASGQSWIRKGGASTFSALSRRAALHPGDIVGTGAGGKTAILFSDGSQVRLNANSAIQITTPQKLRGRTNLFKALSGVLWARLRPDKAAQTQYSNLAVRGTEFQLEVEESGTTRLVVLDSAVEFWNEKGEVVVPAGQGSNIVPGQAPSTPIAVANPGLIIEWTLDLNRVELRREKFQQTPNRELAKSWLTERAAKTKANPDDYDARLQYGDALFDSGNYELALIEYSKLRQNKLYYATRYHRLGDTYTELNRVEEAQAAYEVFTSAGGPAKSMSDPYLTGLVWVALKRGNAAAAQKWLGLTWPSDAEITQFHPQSELHLFEKQPDFLMPRIDAESRIALGILQLRHSDFEAAQKAFDAALQAPQEDYHYQAHAWLAILFMVKNNQARALTEAQLAVQQNPTSPLARGHLALAYFFAGQNGAAEKEARRTIELDPDSVAARTTLAQVLLAQGDVDEAAHLAAQAAARGGAFSTYTADSDFESASGRTYVDLRIAREPSVHNEIFVQVTNLLDRKQIEFERFPTNRRRITAGWTHRF